MEAQALLVAHLGRELAVPCSALVPRQRPPEFLTVERTGGPCDEFTDSAQLAVQCWAGDYLAARSLALRARKAIRSFGDLDEVASSTCESMYPFPGEGGEPRWQLTVSAEVYM